ncbi:MAG: CAP domain-containing protein [Ruminococcus sp.]|nr:CAP domain-containing protein [Ruminococcus sp.]
MKKSVLILCCVMAASALGSCGELGEKKSSRIASLSAPVTGITTTTKAIPAPAVTTAATDSRTEVKSPIHCRSIEFDGGYVLFANKDGTYTIMNSSKKAVKSLTLTDDQGDSVTIITDKNGIRCMLGEQEIYEFSYKGNSVWIIDNSVFFAGTRVEYYDPSFHSFAICDGIVIECIGKNKFIIKEDGKKVDKATITDDNGVSYSLEAQSKGIWIVNSADELVLSVVINGKYIDVANDHIIVNGQNMVPPGANDISTATTTTTTTKKKEADPKDKETTTAKPTTTTTTTTAPQYDQWPEEEYTEAPEQPVVTESPMASNKNVGISENTEELLKLVNEVRKQYGLNELYGLALLDDACAIRAEETCEQFFDNNETLIHSRPDGSGCETVVEEVGLPDWTAYCENLAYGMNSNWDVKDVFNAWMNSEGHRKNILNPDVKYMGVYCYKTTKDGNDYYFWAQFFYNDTF